MKLGFVFPGQGAQSVGMGKDIYEHYEEYRRMYASISTLLKMNIEDLTFSTSEENLSQTKNAQISIFSMSLGILEILKKNRIYSDFLTGLSLGEYSALLYAGSFRFEDGLQIVKSRGEIMQENIPHGEWLMAAIIGLDDLMVENICSDISNGFVVPSNYNCPGQIVISGEKEAVELAVEKAKENGCKKAILLKTTGPFHTEKLKAASTQFQLELQKYALDIPNKTVIKNIDASTYLSGENISNILVQHMISPVKFHDCIKKMIALGIDTFIEVGPGKVLSGFIKKIDPNVMVLNTHNKEDLEFTMNYIKEHE